MSSVHPTEDPFQSADPAVDEPALAVEIRERGEPLLEALDVSEQGSTDRAEAMGAYALATAVGLGFSRAQAELCRQTARLADIGAIYGPTDVHHEASAQLARGAGVPGVACEWLLGVAEHYDGSGPGGLSGAEIPVLSRIIRVAKRCEEINSTGGSPAELRALAGGELDPAMVDALALMLERASNQSQPEPEQPE